MADVIQLSRPAAPTPTPMLDQYRHALEQWPTVEPLPLNILAAMRAEIGASLKPAQHWEVLMAIAALQASMKMPGTIDDPEKFAEAMVIEVSESGYPVDVLLDAVRVARRTLDWFPSIKDMLEFSNRANRLRREPLRIIASMERAHESRRERAEAQRRVAELEAEHKARIENDRQRQNDRLQSIEEAARKRCGDDAPFPGDVALADSISADNVTRDGLRVAWQEALCAGQLWAAKFCRLMALAERARRAINQGRINWDECLAIGKLIAKDEVAARSLIEKAEACDLRPQYEGQPLESFWNALWKIHRACGIDTPRLEEDAIVNVYDQLKSIKASEELAKMREPSDRKMMEDWQARHPLLYPNATNRSVQPQ